MESSAVCKLFCHVSRKNKLFVKKLDNFRKLFTCDKWIFDSCYGDVFTSFSNQLFVYLKRHVNEEKLLLVKDVLMNRLYYSVLPLRVWNHIFPCERLDHFSDMCRYCTKLCIKNKKISDHINNNSFVHIDEFPEQLKKGFSLIQKIPLFVHTNVVMKNSRSNFEGIFYESISSPYLLWKFYIDVLCRTVFNVSYEFIFPLLMSGIDLNCRDFACCTTENCSGLGKDRVKSIFFREVVDFCIKLSEFCRKNINSDFIIDVFKIYKRGEDYFSGYLDI